MLPNQQQLVCSFNLVMNVPRVSSAMFGPFKIAVSLNFRSVSAKWARNREM
jgi:hypothetical protein